MSVPTQPKPVKLVMGVLCSDEGAGAEAVDVCETTFGAIESRLPPVPFHWSQYYAYEMGEDLTRSWLSFERTVDPEELSAIKHATNKIEETYAVEGRRRVNLDPGLVTHWNLVLATTKARHQRVYISDGIYGDVTLIYHTGEYHPMEWTYPDWGCEETLTWLKTIREKL